MSVIQHRNWPLRSTILNAHGTNASPDGLCTRTHTKEAFSCWFYCNSFRVDRARRGNVSLEAYLGRLEKAWIVVYIYIDYIVCTYEPYPWDQFFP